MRHSLKILLSVASLTMGVERLTAEPSYVELKLVPIKPKTLQGEAMIADAARGRPIYKSDTKDLWFVGDASLWRWNLEDGSASRLPLPKHLHTPFRLLGVDGQKIAGFDDSAVWLLDHTKLSWVKLNYEFQKGCLAKAVPFVKSITHFSSFLLSACGSYIIDSSAQRVDFRASKLLRMEEVQGLAAGEDSLGEFIVFTQKRQILRERFRAGAGDREVVYVSKFDLQGVVGGIGNIFAWTDKALVVFDLKVRRQKVVPVVGQRKISSFGLSHVHHALIFDDGTMELMDIKSKKKWFGTGLPRDAQSIDFIEDGKYMVVSVARGEPQVFRVTPD